MTSLVSILMPVFNGELYLSEAINSVLNQTFKNFEFIIINDGSTDSTQKIIDSYKDPRIKCINQNNQGVAKSLNNALMLASGDFIWRHDADDTSLPEQLQTQVDFLEAHPDFALVATQIAFMSDRGKIAYNFKQPKDTYFQGQTFRKVDRAQFNPYSPITHATVLVKKEVFDEVGIYRTEFRTSEDTDLWLRIIEKFDAAVLHYCSYFVRLNRTSATQVYKKTNTFYRDLAFQLADERAKIGTDLLQRREIMPTPKAEQINVIIEQPLDAVNKGRYFRRDLLDFQYKVMLDAKDYTNVYSIIKLSLKNGWKVPQTWRAILFPMLGEGVINMGVKLKSLIK